MVGLYKLKAVSERSRMDILFLIGILPLALILYVFFYGYPSDNAVVVMGILVGICVYLLAERKKI